MEGTARAVGSRLNEIPHNKLCVSNSYINRMWRRMRFPKKGAYQGDQGGQRAVMPDNFIETMKLYMRLRGPAVINLSSLHYQYLYCRAAWLWKDCYRCVFHILTFIQPETWSQTSIRNRTSNKNWILVVPLKRCERFYYTKCNIFIFLFYFESFYLRGTVLSLRCFFTYWSLEVSMQVEVLIKFDP